MIFVTVGIEKFPFDRLVRTMEEAVQNSQITQPVFAQIGHSTVKPSLFSWREFVGFNEIAENIKNADVVVSHAGAGTTLLCLSLGKIPILMPRKASLGEHLDDHQMEFAQKMNTIGKALIAYTEEDLLKKITHYSELVHRMETSSFNSGQKALVEHLRKEVGQMAYSAGRKAKH